MEQLTHDEIVKKLRNNSDFALKSVIDNNFPGVQEALKKISIQVDTPQKALQTLQNLYVGDKKRLKEVLGNVKYVEKRGHYTQDLKKYAK